MKRPKSIGMLFLLSVGSAFLLVQCGKGKTEYKDIDKNLIFGEWTCLINDTEYHGTEKICFFDSIFSVSDSVHFSSEDNGFKFSIDLMINSGGIWQLRNDSIYLQYDSGKTNISSSKESFSITASKKTNNPQPIPEILRTEMCERLETHLVSSQTEKYRVLSDTPHFFGKIILLTKDSLCLENNNVYLTLSRNY